MRNDFGVFLVSFLKVIKISRILNPKPKATSVMLQSVCCKRASPSLIIVFRDMICSRFSCDFLYRTIEVDNMDRKTCYNGGWWLISF